MVHNPCICVCSLCCLVFLCLFLSLGFFLVVPPPVGFRSVRDLVFTVWGDFMHVLSLLTCFWYLVLKGSYQLKKYLPLDFDVLKGILEQLIQDNFNMVLVHGDQNGKHQNSLYTGPESELFLE